MRRPRRTSRSSARRHALDAAAAAECGGIEVDDDRPVLEVVLQRVRLRLAAQRRLRGEQRRGIVLVQRRVGRGQPCAQHQSACDEGFHGRPQLPSCLAMRSMPACAQAASLSPPGAPETPTAPTSSLPAKIGRPPSAPVTPLEQQEGRLPGRRPLADLAGRTARREGGVGLALAVFGRVRIDAVFAQGHGVAAVAIEHRDRYLVALGAALRQCRGGELDGSVHGDGAFGHQAGCALRMGHGCNARQGGADNEERSNLHARIRGLIKPRLSRGIDGRASEKPDMRCRPAHIRRLARTRLACPAHPGRGCQDDVVIPSKNRLSPV